MVEGAKSVLELLQSDYQVQVLFTTSVFFQEHIRFLQPQSYEIQEVSQTELERLGDFQSNNACVAVAHTKPNEPVVIDTNEYVLALDEVKDPGNLGTILRVADWYGIRKIVCSENTTDLYNPKVIAASMGSFTRVQLYYCDLAAYLQGIQQLAVYGAFLAGEKVHQVPFAPTGMIVVGNEAQGIRPEIAAHIQHPIHIPRYGNAESLNVGIATAVICDNLKRMLVG